MSCQAHRAGGGEEDRTGEQSGKSGTEHPVKNPIRIHRKEGEDREKKRQDDKEGKKQRNGQHHQKWQHHEDRAFLRDGDQPMGRDEEQKDRSALRPRFGKSEERLAEGVHDYIGGSDNLNIRLQEPSEEESDDDHRQEEIFRFHQRKEGIDDRKVPQERRERLQADVRKAAGIRSR